MRPDGRSEDRIPELDILRGFALCGILLVNAELMAGPEVVFGGGGGGSGGFALDRLIAWLVTALVTAKFYPLFAFLFGYGFVCQMRAAERAGVPFAPRHLRRTGGLFAIGVLHAVLLYPGDILTTYAALALPLFALRGIAPRTALRVAAGLVVGLSVLLLGYGLLVVAATGTPAASPGDPFAAALRGDAPSVLRAHLRALSAALGANVLYSPQIFAMFLTGLAAARLRILERYGRDAVWLRRTGLRCLPVGLAGGAVTALCANGPLDGRWFLVGHAVGVLTGPALTASYACGVLLFVRGRTAGVIAGAGRLALTHYLTQSLVLAWVFTGYGLGLYGRVGAGAVVAGCVVLYLVQLAVSRPLLARASHGPAELLLRTLTLGRRPARAPAACPATAPRSGAADGPRVP
ncbi:DUF418 domain-containing protein [Streptomyces sp. NPDC092369]|uniref:DUF418 domain-containing protein n=1 Tax=Streptomyces sp. NPDC092369 TaxID=3366015 RepID=UPI00382A91B3